jgi:hypothetical protein
MAGTRIPIRGTDYTGVAIANVGTTFESSANTDVGTTTELINTFDVTGLNTLSVEAIVTAQDLNAFEIYARRGDGGTYQLIASVSADYTSPSGYLESCGRIITATGADAASDDLTATPALESAVFDMNVAPFDSVQVHASCGTTGGTVTTAGVGY